MNTARRPPRRFSLAFDQIDVPDSARPVNDIGVAALAESIERLGLQVPLTVVEHEGRYRLIAGRQRLEALRHLGHNEALVPPVFSAIRDFLASLPPYASDHAATETPPP